MMQKFVKRAKENKKKMVEFIRNQKKLNKTIYLYGASTKGKYIASILSIRL